MNSWLRGIYCVCFFCQLPIQTHVHASAECNPSPTHVIQLEIDTTGIEAKESSGGNLELLDLRYRLTQKLRAAGIHVPEDGTPNPVPGIPATHIGRLALRLNGSAYQESWQEIQAGGRGAIHQYFTGISLKGILTLTIGDSTQTDQFESVGGEWSTGRKLPETAVAAPYDCAVLESAVFLKSLYKWLATLVGHDNSSRAVIEGYRGEFDLLKDSTLTVIHNTLRESRPDALAWLKKELLAPCDSRRRRVVNVMPVEFYARLYEAESPAEVYRIIDSCKGGTMKDTHLHCTDRIEAISSVQ